MSESISRCGLDYELKLTKKAAAEILGDAWKVPRVGYQTDVRKVRPIDSLVEHCLALGNFSGTLVLFSWTTPRSQWAEAFNVEGAV